MNRLSFKEVMDAEYKFIFEYFDSPLSFISVSKKRNYFFYYINDDSFFVSELKKKDFEILNETKNLKKFMDYLVNLDKVNIINFNFDNDEVQYLTLEQADFEVEKFLPKTNKIIDYDYNLEIEIPYDYDYSRYLEFPLEVEDITLRVYDNVNSHSYNFDIIDSAMKYVKKSFDSIKQAAITADNIINQNLMVSPFTTGSFKLNFLISDNDSLLADKIDFFPILNVIDEVTVSNRELNLELIDEELGIELIQNIDELYSIVKHEGVSIAFYGNENLDSELVKIAPNSLIDNNLDVFKEKISERNQLIVTHTELDVPNSRFISGSVIYNSVKIDIDETTQIAKFESGLFRRIKDGTQHLTLDKKITLKITIETSRDINNNLVKEVFIINSFNYL